jgi:hypothetical protein
VAGFYEGISRCPLLHARSRCNVKHCPCLGLANRLRQQGGALAGSNAKADCRRLASRRGLTERTPTTERLGQACLSSSPPVEAIIPLPGDREPGDRRDVHCFFDREPTTLYATASSSSRSAFPFVPAGTCSSFCPAFTSATPSRMMIIAATVTTPMGSPASIHPNSTATAGFTYA